MNAFGGGAGGCPASCIPHPLGPSQLPTPPLVAANPSIPPRCTFSSRGDLGFPISDPGALHPLASPVLCPFLLPHHCPLFRILRLSPVVSAVRGLGVWCSRGTFWLLYSSTHSGTLAFSSDPFMHSDFDCTPISKRRCETTAQLFTFHATPFFSGRSVSTGSSSNHTPLAH